MNLELKEIKKNEMRGIKYMNIITYFVCLFIDFNMKILDNTYSISTTPSTTHNLNIMIDR